MMVLQISNEAVLAGSFLLALIVAVIISSIIYFVLRRGINALRSQFNTIPVQFQQINSDLTSLKLAVPQINSNVNDLKLALPRYEEVNDLKKQLFGMDEQQKIFINTVTSTLDSFKRGSAEEMNNIRTDMIKLAQDKSIEVAKTHIQSNSVSRDEFNVLKERIERVLGSEELVERLELLGTLFDTTNIRTLVWQCKLIRLTENGLAPDVEEGVLVQAGISLSSAKPFLKKLAEKGIVSTKKVESYYLVPEYTWLTTYAVDPDALQQSLQNYIKKEQEYQKYLRENTSLIEDGIIVVSEQYEVDSGFIDILCRDKNGLDVGLELKYPAASNTVIGQILRYKEDYRRKTVNGNMRFIVVAPKISTKLKDLLSANTIEYKEIPF